MMSDWRQSTLGEICDEVKGIIRTGPFGSQLHQSDYKDIGIPVIMPKNIINDRIDTTDIARISKEDEIRLAQHKVSVGDIIYGRRGDIGRHALITTNEDGWLCGTGSMRISLGSSILNPTFLHYYLCQRGVIDWIYNQAIGATMPNLNTTIIRSIPISYPSLLSQHKIASILSAYDDLIENNTRRIKILEEMAQRLYREWFVHFRYPGHENDKLIESELGLIPEGWGFKPVPEAIQLNPTLRLNQSTDNKFVAMGDIEPMSMLVRNFECRDSKSGSKFQNGDTLMARITPSLEHGKTAFVQFLSADSEIAIGSTEFIVLRSKTLSPFLVYCFARNEDFRNHAIRSMVGASGRQRVQMNCFDSYYLPQPPPSLMRKFDEIVEPLFRNSQILFEKNKTLKKTRDILLPKLISGKIDISELDIETGTNKEPEKATNSA